MISFHMFILTGMLSAIAISALIVHLFWQKSNLNILKTHDKKSLLVFRLLYPASIIICLFLYYFKIGYIAILDIAFIDWMAIFLFGIGMLIRWIAIISLRQRFTVKVTILKEHRLKTNGIYSYMRHPSYSGLLIYYLGLGLAMHNWLCILCLFAAVIPVLIYRIRIEEEALLAHFGDEYIRYSAITNKLFPRIF